MFGWACDFETHTGPDTTWVWAWGASSIDNPENFISGNIITSFLSWAKNKRKIYFHNLKFDGSFILDALSRSGWVYTHERPKKPRQFSALISNSGLWYKITLKFKNSVLEIFDSLKKLPMSIDAMAQAFNLPILKGSIDFSIYRPPGHNPTTEELQYLKNDCTILALALKEQFESGLSKMTIGSDAMDWFKSLTHFDDIFPALDPIVDKECRAAYKGGWVYCNKPGDYPASICFDVNSLYPFVMYSFPMPCSHPLWFDGPYTDDDEYPLFIISFYADFKLKPGMLPTIQLKHSRWHADTDYIVEHHGFTLQEPITLTSIDFNLFLDHYDVFEISFIGGYKFKQISGVFKDYIDHWMRIKSTSTGGKRALAKLMLNSLYGKFGKNPDTTRKDVQFYDDKIHTKPGPKEQSNTVYVPLAAFVTAYARRHTITAAQCNIDRFIYADTDSIHLVGHDLPKQVDVHPSNLGSWKLEYRSSRSRYLKAKRYMVSTFDETGITKLSVTCAGMPDNIKKQVNWENFVIGHCFEGKLVHSIVPGGAVLINTSFKLS